MNPLLGRIAGKQKNDRDCTGHRGGGNIELLKLAQPENQNKVRLNTLTGANVYTSKYKVEVGEVLGRWGALWLGVDNDSGDSIGGDLTSILSSALSKKASNHKGGTRLDSIPRNTEIYVKDAYALDNDYKLIRHAQCTIDDQRWKIYFGIFCLIGNMEISFSAICSDVNISGFTSSGLSSGVSDAGACDISVGTLWLFISWESSRPVAGVMVKVIGLPERLASQVFLEWNVPWQLPVLGICQARCWKVIETFLEYTLHMTE
ncbi:hypothetical protein Tco_0097343 [Tanacetum coccineum]